jgi:hypothetical protein
VVRDVLWPALPLLAVAMRQIQADGYTGKIKVVRRSNIFYNLTAENENATTELLCNLLRIKFFRDICLDFFGISRDIYAHIEPQHISSQYTIDDGGRPDIYIKNREALYLIENKISAYVDLQDSQVTTYADYVAGAHNDHKGYFFIIPQGYIHKEEIEKAQEKYPFIKIIKWDAFLEHLSKMELENCSLVMKESLEYLNDLILGIPDPTLNIYEVAAMYNPKDIYTVLSLLEKNLHHVYRVAERLQKKLGEDKFVIVGDQHDKYGYGIYVNYNNNHGRIYLGLSLGLAEENDDYVYSLAIEKKCAKPQDKFPCITDSEYMYIPIDRKLFLDESQEEKLCARVMEILEAFF